MANKNAVLPVSGDVNDVFKQLYTRILNDINNHGKHVPNYKNGPIRRAWGVCSFTVCCLPLCSPCLVWDCLCCVSKLCCNHSGRWGLGCKCVEESCKEVFRDMDEYVHKYIVEKKDGLMKNTVNIIAHEYLKAYDSCIAKHNEQEAKKAYGIRDVLYDMLRRYGPLAVHTVLLTRDSDIEKLRTRIHQLDTVEDCPVGRCHYIA